ncbi:hypothetical protein [Pseudescherichia sp. L3]|uniref:hypothetical protein n=1 Tax=Pseudescherichia sp. L3 TaxID=2970817 RepID=UPI00214F636C|nr:hypothetical protein [Pseudescherichia sp. L3]MCR4457906.1 hypothetical protein [Pseudescherichia sp. L3]
MKEQLANMTIIELVTKSHKATSNQLSDEMPVLVTELASRLEALNLAYIGAMNNLRSVNSTIERMGGDSLPLLRPAGRRAGRKEKPVAGCWGTYPAG